MSESTACVNDCGRIGRRKLRGMCNPCYDEWRGESCTVPGCRRWARAKGLCSTHYNQQYQPDRHKKVQTPCAVCGTVVPKEPHAGRQPVCSYECRTILTWGVDYVSKVEQRRRSRLPVPAAPSCEIPPRHPARQLAETSIRLWDLVVSVRCVWCDEQCLSLMPRNTEGRSLPRYCSNECREACSRSRGRNRLRAAWVEPTHWRKVAKRDGLRCYICNRMTRPKDFTLIEGRDGRDSFVPGSRYPTLEHVVALANGGEHSMSNARIACHDCNSHKGDRQIDVQLFLVA